MPVLERSAAATDIGPRPGERPGTADQHRGRDAPDVPGEPPGGGRGPRPRRNMPLGLAITLIVLVAALLTYLGMLTQIWANLSGAQLPGA